MYSENPNTTTPPQAVHKNIIFINKILRDGLGDLGHLVNIASPEAIKRNSPTHDPEGNPIDYHPIYIIILDHPNAERIRHLLCSLKANKMIEDDNNPYELNQDNQVNAYLSHVLKNNEHLILSSSYEQNRFEGSHKDDLDLPYNNVSKIRLTPSLSFTNAIFIISYIDSEVEQVRNICRAHYLTSSTQILEHGQNLGKQGYSKPTLLDHVYTMGFYPRSCGVSLKDNKTLSLDEKAKVLTEMHNQKFIYALLDAKEESQISLEQAKEFFSTTLFTPGYLHSMTGSKLFIQSIACSEKAKEYKNLAFYLRESTFSQHGIDLKLLKENGFKEMIIHGKDGQNDIVPIGGEGSRRLSIFTTNSHYMDEADYSTLYQISQLFGGCSGDITLENSLSNHLIPFYEQPRPAKAVIPSLILLAEKYLADPSLVVNYLNILLNMWKDTSTDDNKSQRLGSLMNDKFIKDWQNLTQKILENHNFSPQLSTIMTNALRVSDFINYYLNEFENCLEQKRYSDAVLVLDKAKLQFTDLMSLIDGFMMQDDVEFAAFVYSYLIQTNHPYKVEHLDRTVEELHQAKELGKHPETFRVQEYDSLTKLAHEYGYDKIDFKEIEKAIHHNRSERESEFKYNKAGGKAPAISLWKPSLQVSEEQEEEVESKSKIERKL